MLFLLLLDSLLQEEFPLLSSSAGERKKVKVN